MSDEVHNAVRALRSELQRLEAKIDRLPSRADLLLAIFISVAGFAVVVAALLSTAHNLGMLR